MTSMVDDTIRMSGSPMTVIRSAGNLSSYLWEGTMNRKGLVPLKAYERFYLIPSDSGIVEGDLVQKGSELFLVMSLAREDLHGDLQCFQGTLYKCNSVVTVKKYNSGTQALDVFQSGVNCLITRALSGPGLSPPDNDQATVIPAFKGRDKVFFLIAQSASGIDKTSSILDAAGRSFRVSDDFDPFIVNGILQAEVVWANA